MSKKDTRVLFIGEASYLSTGYAKYTRNVLERLHPHYTVAEFSIYGGPHNEKWGSQPWTSYPNMPINQSEEAAYGSHVSNQFGAWRYNEVVNDFRPHVVIDIRDWWVMSYQELSPYRSNYHWAIMPTVDSAPQMPQWLATFAGADSVATRTIEHTIVYWMDAGTTASTTFSVRAGTSGAGTTYMNGNTLAKMGGKLHSSITITEYAA